MIWTIFLVLLTLAAALLLWQASQKLLTADECEKRTERKLEHIGANVLDARAKIIAATLSKKRLDALEKRINKLENHIKKNG